MQKDTFRRKSILKMFVALFFTFGTKLKFSGKRLCFSDFRNLYVHDLFVHVVQKNHAHKDRES